MKRFLAFIVLLTCCVSCKFAAQNKSELFISYVNTRNYQNATKIIEKTKVFAYDSTKIHLEEDAYMNYLKYIISENFPEHIIENAIAIGVEDFLVVADNEWEEYHLDKVASLLDISLNLAHNLSDNHIQSKIKACHFASSFCFETRNYEAAIFILNNLLELQRKESSSDFVYTLNSLGTAYKKSGNLEMAQKYYIDALTNRKELNVPVDEDYLLNIEDLILIYSEAKDYSNLINFLYEYYSVANYDSDCNFSLYYGQLFREYGPLTDSIFCSHAKMSTMKDEGKALLFDQIGIFYHESVADYPKAEKYYIQALQLSPSNLVKGIILTDIGSLYRDMEYYKKAEKSLLQSLALIPDSLGFYWANIANLGSLYGSMGDIKKSIQYIEKSVLHCPNLDLETKDRLRCKLGDLNFCIENYDAAREYYQAVLDSFKITLSTYGIHWSTNYQWAKSGIANIEYAVENIDAAISQYEELVESYDMYSYKNEKNYLMLVSELANLYLAGEYIDKADSLYSIILKGENEVYVGKYIGYAKDLTSSGIVHQKMNMRKLATVEMQEAFSIFKSQYIDITTFASAYQREKYWFALSPYFYARFPLFAYNQNDEAGNQLLYDVSLFAKGILLSTDIQIQESILSSSNKKIVQKYQKLQELNKTILETKTSQYSTPKEIDSLVALSQSLEKELVEINADFRLSRDQWEITWERVRKKLNNNQLAVEYVSVPISKDSTMYCALLLRNNSKHPELIPLFEEKEVSALVNTTSENQTSFTYSYGGNGQALQKLVWSKVLPYVKPGETIYFAPSGLLYQLAIESLPYDETHTMADMFNLVRLSSTREIVLNKASAQHSTATLYGGIQYNMTGDELLAESEQYAASNLLASRGIDDDALDRGSVKYLPGTKKEVETINQMLHDNNLSVKLYTSTTANEESFKAISGKHQNILHIATHGFYWADSTAQKKDYFSQRMLLIDDKTPTSPTIDPLNRCGLLFAGANTALSGHSADLPEGVQDGILTAKEISLLDLRDADLVILSACETGKGEITGEGVFGLQRAFKQAGAQTIIMSLWPVNDAATQLLMTEFYRNWITNHQSKREAFRNAQNTVRSQYEEPVYWAGFIMLD